VIRTADKNSGFEPERFNTFSPKAISMIGKPANTWIDRSIHIKMSRKTEDIHIEKLPSNFYEQMKPLRQKLIKWTEDNKEALQTDLDIPQLTNDRAMDNWLSLLGIACLLNDNWKQRAINTMVAIEGLEEDEDETRIELLKDIKQAFEEEGNKLPTVTLLEYLNGLEDRPWADFRHGKGMNANVLSKMLRPFGIRPEPIRTEEKVFKGYSLKQLKNVFKCYIPVSNGYTVTLASNQQQQAVSNGYKKENVTASNPSEMASNKDCNRVTAPEGGIEEEKNLQEVEDGFII
jgi:putative DNA primase/helicase